MELVNVLLQLLQRRRKIHHCLFFERKDSNKDSRSPSTGERCNFNNLVVLEAIKRAAFLAEGKRTTTKTTKKRKRSAPEQLAIRKKNIQHTLRQRRNGICNEIERSWFVQGAYLEKHRHNLQVTHELTVRGLMW